MSTQPDERIPEVTLGWRLKMALAKTELSAQDMADQLGVSRQTLSRWFGEEGSPPKRAYLAQWALVTDTPLLWLETGSGSPNGGPGGGQTFLELDAGSSTVVRSYHHERPLSLAS